ncbi:MAG TPA: hypothetical protein VGK90_01195 [Rhizomicrobium sp.]|jgi:hypothetical protein
MRLAPVLLLMGALGGCAAVSDFVLGPVSDSDEGEVVTGVYHRTSLSGDQFDFPCRYGHVCRAVLIRDEYLREHFVELDGRKLELRVKRTNACHDKKSSQFACQTSRDGTALLILEWIEPSV